VRGVCGEEGMLYLNIISHCWATVSSLDAGIVNGLMG